MKNITKIVLGFCVIVLVFSSCWLGLRPWFVYAKKSTYTIALLTRHAPFAEQVTEGMWSEIAKHSEVIIKTRSFYVHGLDQLSTQSIVEEAIAGNPDMIVAMGVGIAQPAAALLKKRKSMIPFIFASAGDPVEQGLVSSMDARLEPVTGVRLGRISYEQSVELLCACKPSVRSLLIPYFPAALGGVIEQAAHDVKKILKDKGITVYLLPLDVRSDVRALVTPFMNRIDTIMCIEGDRIDDYNAALVKLCDEYHVTLYAKEIESVRDGAALGFGTYGKEIGVMIMKYAYQIFSGLVYIGDLPIATLDGARILVLNTSAAARQGLVVTDELLQRVERIFE